MALQVEHGQIGHQVVGVPRMVGHGWFIVTIRQTLAQQAVMFHIVCRGQLPPGNQVVHDEEGNHHQAEYQQQAQLKHRGDGIGLKHGVVRAPGGQVQLFQALFLDAPGSPDTARQFPQGKAVNAFAHARTGVILRRGYPAVMASAVLHREVAIGWHRQYQARQPLLHRVVFVTQLMAGIQAQAGIHASDIAHQQHRPPGQRMGAYPPGTGQQGHKMQGNGGPGQPAVVAILLQLRHHGFGWIVFIFANQPVQQRQQTIANEQGNAQCQLPAGVGMRRKP